MKFPFALALAFGLALASAATPLCAADAGAAEIRHLLGFVRDSSCTFIRNGEGHASPAAADHLEMKAKRAGSRVKDGRTLIDVVATKSYLSGEPYYVQCPGLQKTAAATWLSSELQQYRATQAGAALAKP